MARRRNNRTGTLAATEASDVAAVSGSASRPGPLKFPPNPNVGDTYKHWVWDGEKWAARWGPAPAAEAAKQLPPTRPKDIGPRPWLCAREVYALTREGGKDSKWINLDALLNTIRKRIGTDNVSKRTLNKALAYLRKNHFIDR